MGDLVELEVAVDSVELDLSEGGLADGGALRFHEFDDLHSGFELYGCRGWLVTQNVSKSVECEAAEFVEQEFRSVMAGCEQSAGEVGVFWVHRWTVERWIPAALAAAEMDWPATRACRTSC